MTMKRAVWLLLFLLVLSTLAYYWYDLNQIESPTTASPLARTINACDAIAEKAAMQLPERLPFQRLEKKARRMRVFDICMHDRGFEQNQAWVKDAQTIAKQLAKAQDISESEAYENMRRDSMLLFESVNGVPLYWVSSAPKAAKAD